jgi:hypothetical protein
MKNSIIKTTLFVLTLTIYSGAFSQGNLTFYGAAYYTSTFALNGGIQRVVVDTILISPGYILKIENDIFARLSYNNNINGNLTNINAPIAPNPHNGVAEIINVTNGTRIINSRYWGSEGEKSYPLWLNSGTYHVIWHNDVGSTNGGSTTYFYRYSLHGLLFSIN